MRRRASRPQLKRDSLGRREYVDSRVVNRELRAAVRPVLRAHGFSVFTERTAWRHTPGRIDVVNFQSFNDYLATAVGVTTFSFALNLGQYLRCVPPDDFAIKLRGGLLAPKEWECHLRLLPQRRLEQPELARRDIWFIDPAGTYLEAAVRDVRKVILDVGLAWFDRYADDHELLRALLEVETDAPDGTALGGNLGSPARNLLLGYLCLSLGRRKEALEPLAAALARKLQISASLASKRSKYRPPQWDRLARDVALLKLGV